MRDDFNRKDIETLAKRVAMRCSNPICKCLTTGPNSIEEKATNIGVAAHITAASPKGPRYNPNLIQEERSSIKNAIWLCQSCAKLIDNDPLKYTIELLKEWKLEAEKETELELNNISTELESINYYKIFKLMPDLINEMIDDIRNNPLFREFILKKRGWVYNYGGRKILEYYYDDHEDLDAKMRLLENNGLIEDITYNNIQRYVLTENFVEILTKLEKFII
jgi:hypothetical protein